MVLLVCDRQLDPQRFRQAVDFDDGRRRAPRDVLAI
jgi:hypothetical protein